MNVNSPKFVESQRQKKKERRAKHKERMAKRNKRRADDHKSRMAYWERYDDIELTRLRDSVKKAAQREAP